MKEINIQELKQEVIEENVLVLRTTEGINYTNYRVIKNAGKGSHSFSLFYNDGSRLIDGLYAQDDPSMKFLKLGYEDLSLTPYEEKWREAAELRGILDSKASKTPQL